MQAEETVQVDDLLLGNVDTRPHLVISPLGVRNYNVEPVGSTTLEYHHQPFARGIRFAVPKRRASQKCRNGSGTHHRYRSALQECTSGNAHSTRNRSRITTVLLIVAEIPAIPAAKPRWCSWLIAWGCLACCLLSCRSRSRSSGAFARKPPRQAVCTPALSGLNTDQPVLPASYQALALVLEAAGPNRSALRQSCCLPATGRSSSGRAGPPNLPMFQRPSNIPLEAACRRSACPSR